MGYERISHLRAFAARVAGLFGLASGHDLDEEVQAHLQCWWIVL